MSLKFGLIALVVLQAITTCCILIQHAITVNLIANRKVYYSQSHGTSSHKMY